MDKLGIEPGLLLAQIINFAVIMIVLTKVLYKPILRMLDERKKKIEEGLALTERLKEEEAKTEQKRQKVIDEAGKEGMDLIQEARKNAKEEEKLILAEARNAADEIIEKGKSEADRQKKSMEKNMQDEAIALASLMTKRLLSGLMSSDMQHKVIRQYIKGIKGVHTS